MNPTNDPPPRPEDDPLDDGAGGYRLAGWDAPLPTDEPTPSVPPTPAPPDPPEDEKPTEDEPRWRRPPLPPKPFLTGTFSFPWSASARFHAIGMFALAAIIFYCVARSVALSRLPMAGQGVGMLSGQLAYLAFMWFAIILSLMWFVFGSGCALAVVRETANGGDRVATWPGFAVLEYLFDPLYLLDSWCVSALVGVVVHWLLGGNWFAGLVGSMVMIALFPIILLSTLEEGSPLGVVSWPTWRTLAVAGRGWMAFYGTSTALLMVVYGLVIVAHLIGGLFAVFVAAALTTAGWFIYFRLLGRLAWYCAEITSKETPEEETGDEEDLEELHIEGTTMVPFTFVFCPKCGGRVEVGQVPVGTEIHCDHCGLDFAVEYK